MKSQQTGGGDSNQLSYVFFLVKWAFLFGWTFEDLFQKHSSEVMSRFLSQQSLNVFRLPFQRANPEIIKGFYKEEVIP